MLPVLALETVDVRNGSGACLFASAVLGWFTVIQVAVFKV